MTFTTDYTAEYSKPSWFERSETWLDRKGKGAWIAAMVFGEALTLKKGKKLFLLAGQTGQCVMLIRIKGLVPCGAHRLEMC